MLKKVMFVCVMVLFAGAFAAEKKTEKKVETKPVEEPVPEGNFLKWYGWADIKIAPAIEAIYNLNDNDVTTAAKLAPGPEIGTEIALEFPEPLTVKTFRFYQVWLTTTKYQLLADMKGNGVFDKEIATRKDEKPIKNQWISIPVNMKVHGLKFVALEGQASYRRGYPSISEIQIFTEEKIDTPVVKKEKVSDKLTLGKEEPYPKFTKKKIDLSISADVWMAGIVTSGKNLPEDGDVEKLKGFQNFLGRLKEIDADSVRIFAEGAACSNKMLWKSKICPNFGKDILKSYVDGLHKNGYKAYLFMHAWISPLQKEGQMAPMPWRRWDYPYEQSERLMKEFPQHYKVKYPCVMCEDDFREKWTGILSEAVEASNLDGVFVLPDEYYYKGHKLSLADCPACRKEFKKRFGCEMPKKKSDTKEYRQWKLFEYQKIDEVFDKVAADLKKKYPNLKLVSCGNQGAVHATNQRLEHNMCLDIMGDNEIMDLGQAYGTVPIGMGSETALMKRFEAAFGPDRLLGSIQWLGVKGFPTDFPMQLYGYVLSMVMNGADTIENYRLSYMHDTGWWDNAVKCFKMMRLLEQWGINESKSPSDVCMIISRASEDWWYVKADVALGEGADKKSFNLMYAEKEMGTVDTMSKSERERKINFERFRGLYASAGLQGLLSEGGIPYDVKFADRPDNMKNLNKYKVIVIPFLYALSKDAFAEIKKAVDSGTKLLVFDQKAQVDEIGEPHKKPLLDELLKNENVKFIDENLATENASPQQREKNLGLIKGLLGKTGYYFNNNGKRVEYIVREVKPDHLILYLGNWEKKDSADVVVGVPLPEGKYTVTVCDSQNKELNEGLINGKGEVSADELKKFSVTISPGELKLINIIKK